MKLSKLALLALLAALIPTGAPQPAYAHNDDVDVVSSASIEDDEDKDKDKDNEVEKPVVEKPEKEAPEHKKPAAKPVNPEQPKPKEPVTPAKPIKPEQPKPKEPVTPAKPVNPEQPKPKEPVTPAKPVKPEKPATPAKPKVVKPATDRATLDAALASISFESTLDNRQGMLTGHDSGHRSIWVRAYTSDTNYKKGATFTTASKVLQIGYNHPFATQDGFFGPFLTVGTSNLTSGSEQKNATLFGFGVAATAFLPEGVYLDGTVSINRAKTHDSKSTVFIGSAEIGKRFSLNKNWYAEPQAQLTVTHHSAVGEINGYNSLVGRVSAKIGYASSLATVPFDAYFKANYRKEFKGLKKDTLSLTDGFFSLNLGASAGFTHSSRAFIELEKTFSSKHLKGDWNLSGGIRFNF